MKRKRFFALVGLIFASIARDAQASSEVFASERLGEKNWTEIAPWAHECELNKVKASNRKVSSARSGSDRSVGRSGATVAR